MNKNSMILFAKIQSKLLVICLVTFNLNCLSVYPDGSRYWTNFVSLNEAIRSEFKDTDMRAILFGNLNPKNENLLYKSDDESLYLVINAVENSSTPLKWKVSKDSEINKKAKFHSKTSFTKRKWDKDDIYYISRKQYSSLGDSKPSLTFLSIAKLIDKEPHPSTTQDWLCKSFKCLVQETKQGRILSYRITNDTKINYPSFYETFAPRMDQIKFNAFAIPDHKQSAQIQIFNRERELFVQLPRQNSKDWLNPKQIHITVDFSLESFGVKFQVKQLKYQLNYSNNGILETLSGKFINTPDPEIQGRFFYIIPPGIVDLFIPGNIEEYFRRGLTLLTQGSDGKSGNRFVATFKGKGSNSSFIMSSQSESYQKKFSLFNSDSNKDNKNQKGSVEDFFKDFWLNIARDLSGVSSF
ncbi:hypothetical protein [Leptospira sp. GIMC2001]|uniref:hypothetical protein n=1 Tax=Leptospira sp. GIMC2001 TaxID=1513297 RepID=UPI00234B1BE3|nr:hypothetical protein [Leptospira sp. GIMC2001]WCL49412.1 hypothetical protein O4O04_19300 [Leptospira sp. GIMC2001]